MSADDIRSYKRRWEMVAEVEQRELERMSPAQKFADISMLLDVARALESSAEGDEEVEQVRRRWNCSRSEWVSEQSAGR